MENCWTQFAIWHYHLKPPSFRFQLFFPCGKVLLLFCFILITFFSILFAQDFIHWFTFCQFIYQLIKVSDLLHQRLCNFFNFNTAHRTFYKFSVWIKWWSFLKEVPVSNIVFQKTFDIILWTTSEPAGNLINFFPWPIFAFSFCNQTGINFWKQHTEYFFHLQSFTQKHFHQM